MSELCGYGPLVGRHGRPGGGFCARGKGHKGHHSSEECLKRKSHWNADRLRERWANDPEFRSRKYWNRQLRQANAKSEG